ncbi:hypothetical protein EOA23_00875 [Mesorhizobium sp. M2A.F.Ca.ET.042.01.1.1]|uniref:hypothetical protein n=1 Tax=Mesorhizobium sp. M2A.F.Ca.ET.042.01.1.1 TaxID=2496745 RepID=UPI000FCBB571|nr:hypothetical protein [Mesorhizobium sp. M2A.F.Ca.ET.042.01.1.1]RUX34634.1 hypothetical protein EOA23_00875 [Mesorhizobium sp. M2A.F.Ca.ET.042.01.1.1]
MPQDLLPRIFQADIHRFYTRVMLPALDNLPLRSGVKTSGSAASMAEFLEHAQVHTSNMLAFEARRCFALTLDGLFERQLRIWARVHVPDDRRPGIAAVEVNKLVRDVGLRHGLDLETGQVRATIEELHLLGNAVRHGDGGSLTKLRDRAPHLWHYADSAVAAKSEEHAILSEGIQLSDSGLTRYVRALTRFWGLADREPGAVVDVPY